MMVVLFFFFAAEAALAARLLSLQVIHYRDYARLAAQQQRVVTEVTPERGSIFLQNRAGERVPLAVNRTYKNLVISPKNIENPEEAVLYLTENFDVSAEAIKEKTEKKDDPYEVLLRKVDPKKAEIGALTRLPGIFFEDERRRFYPQEKLAAHVVGFVNKETDEERGQYGVERLYNGDLVGERGIFEELKAQANFWQALGRRIIHPPKSGSDIILTIDALIQRKAEETLQESQKKWPAESAALIVLEPKTGRVLASAAFPVFDPNAFSQEKDFSVFLNPLVEASYELGSVMKPITMAAGIEEKKVTPGSLYNDTGSVKIGEHTIRNFDGNAYGAQTMTEVLEKSLNLGIFHVGKLLGNAALHSYLEKFGFGEATGIDLPGEVSGNIENLRNGKEIDLATASFGQGIAVSPIQLASALGALANGGVLMRPYVVEKIIDDSGNEKVNQPEPVRQVVSSGTAEIVTKMLVSAVRNGFENRAGVSGYFVAGKTGTAQIPLRGGRGYSEDVIHTFVGYAPAFDPKFLIYLQLNKPRGNRFAANTLTPAFHDLAQFILNYYEIPPEEQ